MDHTVAPVVTTEWVERERGPLDILNDPSLRVWIARRKVKDVNYGKSMDLATRLKGVTRCK